MQKIDTFELDALKELGNMGAGHAATSLSQLLGRYIDMSVPEVKIIKTENLDREINVTEFVGGTLASLQDMEGDEVGYLYVVFPKDSSLKLVKMLVGTDNLGELEISALMEVGNILASSFCNAIADFLNITLIPSPPNFAMDVILVVIDSVIAYLSETSDNLIIFRTELKDDTNSINIYLMLFLNEKFLEKIMKIVREKFYEG